MAENIVKPVCFGHLDQVFPLGADGLREVKFSCRECRVVKDCLADAAAGPDGMAMRADRMEESSYQARPGVMGFLERWSRLKSMRRSAASRKKVSVHSDD